MHYRKSGQFAQYLLKNSKDNPALHAYSIGYLSHVAADAVGHPYVNNIVRGPYRTHAKRHNVVEKFQDVSAFDLFESKEFGTSELHEQFRFSRDLFEGDKIPEVESIISGLTPDITDIRLPNDLAKLFSDATKDVFTQDGRHLFGGGMTVEEVDASYRLWYSWFKSSTSEAILPDSLPNLPPLSEEIREVWRNFSDKFKDAMKEFRDAIDDLFSSDGRSFSWRGIVNFFKSIARVMKATLAAAVALIQAIEETIISIPKRALHILLNQLYQKLYTVYDYFRLSVSLTGLAFPGVRHLNDKRVEHMLDPRLPDITQNRLSSSLAYPMKIVDPNSGRARITGEEAHLYYQLEALERESTNPSPLSYNGNPHSYYIDQDIRMDLDFIENLRAITDFDLHHNLTKNEVLGNACELTGALYNLFANDKNIPDINLDADRGIAYPCWEPESCTIEDSSKPVEPVEPVTPKFTD